MESERVPTKMSPAEEEQCYGETIDMLMMCFVPHALKAAIKLGVLEIIAKAAPGSLLSASEITSQISTQNPDASPLLDSMLTLLSSQSILVSSVSHGETRFGLGPKAKYFVKLPHGAPLTPFLIILQDKAMMDVWYELEAVILQGGSTAFERVHGVPFFNYVATNREFGGVFYDSMLSHTKFYIERLLELDSYKGFENIKSLVDVAGAYGQAVAAIIAKYPHIKGINFDLPATIQQAPSHPGVEHVGGDMFISVPEADAMFIKWIFHDWDDDNCLKLLKNCYKALPEHGKLIIVERLEPEKVSCEAGKTVKHSLSFDAFMGLYSPGAKSRSRAEFQALADAAGFKGTIRIECCIHSLWLMEIHK